MLSRLRRASWLIFETLARGACATPRAKAEQLRASLSELADIHRLAISARGVWSDGPAILVANHVSYMDPVAIGSLFACSPIAKAEVAGWPAIGSAAAALGVSFVKRGDAWSGARCLLRARATLAAGVPVLAFPEGTTTDGTRLAPFHRGIFGLARLVGVPVVPIAIRYASPDMAWVGGATFLPHYLRTTARASIGVSLEVGAPIDWHTEDLVRVTHQRIARMLRDHHHPEPHATSLALRVPAPRPDPVLPVADRRVAGAR
jgi:1-acyl-sn-glycerol-3-phosphate acyltransferase